MDDKELKLERNPGFFKDVADFLITNKKWWLIPVVVVIFLVGVLVVLGGSSIAPFIYSLF